MPEDPSKHSATDFQTENQSIRLQDPLSIFYVEREQKRCGDTYPGTTLRRIIQSFVDRGESLAGLSTVSSSIVQGPDVDVEVTFDLSDPSPQPSTEDQTMSHDHDPITDPQPDASVPTPESTGPEVTVPDPDVSKPSDDQTGGGVHTPDPLVQG